MQPGPSQENRSPPRHFKQRAVNTRSSLHKCRRSESGQGSHQREHVQDTRPSPQRAGKRDAFARTWSSEELALRPPGGVPPSCGCPPGGPEAGSEMPRSVRSQSRGPLPEQPGQEWGKIGRKSLPPPCLLLSSPLLILLLPKPHRRPVTEGGGGGPGSAQGADKAGAAGQSLARLCAGPAGSDKCLGFGASASSSPKREE